MKLNYTHNKNTFKTKKMNKGQWIKIKYQSFDEKFYFSGYFLTLNYFTGSQDQEL